MNRRDRSALIAYLWIGLILWLAVVSALFISAGCSVDAPC